MFRLLNEYRDKQDWYSVCSKIVLCCIEHRQISHAIDVLQQLKVREKSFVDIVCNEIFSLVCDSNTAKLEDCLALLEAMRKEIFVQPSRITLDFLLNACVSRKDSYTAKLILKEYTNEGFPFNVITLLRMFQVFLASGDQADATVILKIMSRKDRKDQRVKYLIKMYCKHTMFGGQLNFGNIALCFRTSAGHGDEEKVALKVIVENLSEEEIVGLKEMFKSMDITLGTPAVHIEWSRYFEWLVPALSFARTLSSYPYSLNKCFKDPRVKEDRVISHEIKPVPISFTM
ncbi:hypothetical protein SUGI_1104460 [Cryptomeria japonica]|nr:hypothetical protein SUGI_1104460 [Cryptomeria japonica]